MSSKYYCNKCKGYHLYSSDLGKDHISSSNSNAKLRNLKLMEKDLILMTLNQLASAEKERRLNTAQKRRRQELKQRLKQVNELLEKIPEKKQKNGSERINKKDKRKLEDFHYKILIALKERPNTTKRGIYIEDNLIKTIPKKVMDDLESWNYVNKSDKNRFSLTKQGKWKLTQFNRQIEARKKRAKIKEYKDTLKKLVEAKKNLPIMEKRLREKEEELKKLLNSVSEQSKEEWRKHQYDYKHWEFVKKEDGKWGYKEFPWTNPNEVEIIISIRTTEGSREVEYRKLYREYYDTKSKIEYYEKRVDKDILTIVNKSQNEVRKEIILLEDKLSKKLEEPSFTNASYEAKLKEINRLQDKIAILKSWL